MKQLYHDTTLKCSKLITHQYSTSFTLGIRTLSSKYHDPIYAIYGFVRFADEIVDTFHEFDKRKLLKEFKADTYRAINDGISFNPVLHAFQRVVNQYKIDLDLIEAFLHSMEMDLENEDYDRASFKEYVYGSAEVVGLMCLKVFCEDHEEKYQSLIEPAKRLGAAFQKINFLRDLKSDFVDRGRTYFPGLNMNEFNNHSKSEIEQEIEEDFKAAYKGIVKLPKGCRLGVYLAYVYYINLFRKIQKLPASKIMEKRIRVPDTYKFYLLLQSYFKESMNVI